MSYEPGLIRQRMTEVERAIDIAIPFAQRLEALAGLPVPPKEEYAWEESPMFQLNSLWQLRVAHWFASDHPGFLDRWGEQMINGVELTLWLRDVVDDSLFSDHPKLELVVTHRGVFDIAACRFLDNDEIERLEADLEPVLCGEVPLIHGVRPDLPLSSTDHIPPDLLSRDPETSL